MEPVLSVLCHMILQKMSGCLTALSSKLKSMESVLQVPGDDEAIEYFSNTKLGEASRMGSK